LLSTAWGALLTFIPQLIRDGTAERRERGRELWRRDVDLCAELEEIAGEITDRMSGWAMRPEDWDPMGKKIGDLARLSGKLPRHPPIQRAIRDLHNTASRMWADRNRYDSNEERKAITAELEERQTALLAACGQAIGREAPMNRRSDN
jgi:hypothetical protein